MANVAELQRAYDEASADFGRAMAGWERGTVSNQERGQAKRRMNKARDALTAARSVTA